MDLEQSRYNMVEQQIRTWDVLDQEVLQLLFELRREEFVPAAYRSLAFVDMEIPLGYGEVMLAPKVEARILQELGINNTDRILEVGSGEKDSGTENRVQISISVRLPLSVQQAPSSLVTAISAPMASIDRASVRVCRPGRYYEWSWLEGIYCLGLLLVPDLHG